MGGIIGLTTPTDQVTNVIGNPYSEQGNADSGNNTTARETSFVPEGNVVNKNIPVDVIPWALAAALAYGGYQIAKKAKNKEGKPAGIAKYAWAVAIGMGLVGAAGGGMLSTGMYKATA